MTRATRAGWGQGEEWDCRVVAEGQRAADRTLRWQCGRNRRLSTVAARHKRVLKVELKLRRRTGAARKDLPQMFHGLQPRIRLSAAERPAEAAQPNPQPIQLATQFALDPIDRFQSERQAQRFDRRLDGISRQQSPQQWPEPRGAERVTGEHLGQDQRKRPPATAPPPAIGTKHPLPPHHLARRPQRIVAEATTMPVQRAHAAAMRTGRLLERKSRALNSCGSRTKWKGNWNTRNTLPENPVPGRAFFDGTVPGGATRFRKDRKKRRTALTAPRPRCHRKRARTCEDRKSVV